MPNPDFMLYDASDSRAIDAAAIAQIPVPGFTLMQHAAEAAFAALLQHFSGTSYITVLCGKGNNAGDAYLVAALAMRYGIDVQLIAVVDPQTLNGDAALAYQEALAAGVTISPAPDAIIGEVIVDGLLGTGLSGAPREPFSAAIKAINAVPQPVLAIDVPSGVSADTGAVHDELAVQATVTVSFITRKIGLYTGAGVSYAGIREQHRLGVPGYVYAAASAAVPLVVWDPVLVPALDPNTYKHRQGHVVIAGGDTNMPGAVSLAAEAALRSGAGMVTVVTRAEHTSAIVARTPEAMVIDAEAAEDVLARADLFVLGPGLGREAWGEALFEKVMATGKPTVLDADGLHWLSCKPGWTGGVLVMTPHIAEAAKLLGESAAEVQRDRLKAGRTLAERFGACGVVKGAGTVVFHAEGVGILAHGNPGMASAGMGDVLSGIMGGLLAPLAQDAGGEAWCTTVGLAAALHSASADQAVQAVGERSLLARDVTHALPTLLRGEAGRMNWDE